MKRITQALLAGVTLAALVPSVSNAATVTVLDTSLPVLNGTVGAGVATTVDLAGTPVGGNGRITTVDGPSGGPNRASANFAFEQWQQRNVGGGGSVGITDQYARTGNGSITFLGTATSPTSGSYKADLEYYFTTSVALAAVTKLGFDWLRDSASTAGDGFHPTLRLVLTNGTGGFGNLVYERTYNGLPGAVPVDQWTTENIVGAKLWASGTLPDAFNNYDRTLSDWDALLDDTWKVVGLSAGIGSGWAGTSFAGAMDNITFNDTTWNFEVAPGAVVPLPGSLALLGIGALAFVVRRRRG